MSREPSPKNPLLDAGVDRSIINLVPLLLGQKIQDAYFEHPDFFDIPERQLRDKFKESGKTLSTTENQLRLRFWYEYDFAQANGGSSIDMSRVIKGVCTLPTFTKLSNCLEFLAWLLCMPTGYESHVNEMLDFGATRMREIMRMEARDPLTGKVNVALLKIQKDLYLAAELRKFGGITQVTKNLNVNIGQDKTGASVEARGDEIIEKKIKELKERQRSLIKVKDEDIIDV